MAKAWSTLGIIVGLMGLAVAAFEVHPGSKGAPPPTTATGHQAHRDPRGTAKQKVHHADTPPPPPPATYTSMHVPAQSQYPQLQNGCEVTSLSMLLNYMGYPVSKMTLAAEQPTDPTPAVLNPIPGFKGNPILEVVKWGNPNVGFVGSVAGGAQLGYGIYNGPLLTLLNQIAPGQGINLTGDPFADILQHVAEGVPVEVWTTINFEPTNQWVTWQSPEGPVTATPMEHAVLIVGYTPTTLLIDNPANGEAGQVVNRAEFVEAWHQLGRQAITMKGPKTGASAS